MVSLFASGRVRSCPAARLFVALVCAGGLQFSVAPDAAGQTTSGFHGLGFLATAASFSEPLAVSSDGNTVVGTSRNAESDMEAFRWTPATGMVGLGDLTGGTFASRARGVSADGSVVVGEGETTLGDRGEAFRWTEPTGMVSLGSLPGGPLVSRAYGVSADGNVVVGHADNAEFNSEAFRWSGGVMEGLGDIPGGPFDSQAYAVSADGSTVVGYGEDSEHFRKAVRWKDGVMLQLGNLSGGGNDSEAYAVSADGSVVVGWAVGATDAEAFRWTESGGMVSLGSLPAGHISSEALGVSADGQVVVGYTITGPGNAEAFVWTPGEGMRSVRDVLAARGHGALLEGWTLSVARAVSADGRVIVGRGVNPQGKEEGWRAVLSTEHRWIDPAGGAWDVADNWSTGTIPDSTSTVVFNLPDTYTVSGSAPAGKSAAARSVARLSADAGTVDFNQIGVALTAPTVDELPSLSVNFDATVKIVSGTATFVDGVVGFAKNAPDDSTTTARLQVFNAGTELIGSGYFFVGGLSGGRGDLFVSGGSLRTNRAIVGTDEPGEAVVGNEGSWTVESNLTVGFLAPGRLIVEEGGSVSTRDLSINEIEAGRASVEVTGAGPSERSRLFVADTMVVGGDGGDGGLSVTRGGEVTVGVLRLAVSSGLSMITVGERDGDFLATLVADRIELGFSPDALGLMAVGAEGFVTAHALNVGTDGGSGSILVYGDPAMEKWRGEMIVTRSGFTGECGIGSQLDRGTLFLYDSGYMRCDGMKVAAGSVFVGDATRNPLQTDSLVVSGLLTIGEGGPSTLTLAPTGVVDALDLRRNPPDHLFDIFVDDDGRIEGSGVVLGEVLSSGVLAPGLTPVAEPPQPALRASASAPATRALKAAAAAAGGTLVIKGRYVQEEGGVLELPISGLAPEQHGRLVLESVEGRPELDGSVALGGTLRLAFQDGYAPRMGDTFALVEAASTTGAFQTVEVTGLAPGFQLDVSTGEDGAIEMTALSDGIAVSSEAERPRVPTSISLRQNVPNPFRGRTEVVFNLPLPVDIRLAVYDMLGREIAVLAEGRYPAGTHRAVFSGAGRASGVYYCRLQAGPTVHTRAMTLIR